MLQRYSKNAVTDPEFNRKDYKQTAPDGTSLEYRRTIPYNEAIKTVNKGCSSDQMFDIALKAFREVNSRMDDEANHTAQRSPREEATERAATSEDPPDAENNDQYADILPPPVAKTKGSRKTEKEKVTAKKLARPEPQLDETGAPKGQRLCSICNKIAGHNARTCLKRQLAQKLLETHQQVYGTTTPVGKVKTCIKNLLANQDVEEGDDEELLDTDAEDGTDDETEEDELEEQEDEGDETETSSEDDEEPGDEDSEMEVTKSTSNSEAEDEHVLSPNPQPANSEGRPATGLGNIDETQGQRVCSVCGKKVGHNARTCPDRFKVQQQQLEALQTGETTKMMPQGVCTCGKIRGHNARTCKRLQLEEQIRKQQEDLLKQQKKQLVGEKAEKTTTEKRQTNKRKKTVDTAETEQPRRSSRFQQLKKG